MTIQDFFNLKTKLLKPQLITDVDRNTGLALLEGNYKGLHFPIIFKLRGVKEKLTDWMCAGLFPCIISDALKIDLEQAQLTGWVTFPITILDKKNCPISGYHGFSVFGKCGPIDFTKSEIIEKRFSPRAPLQRYYRGLHIGIDKWDGSDFFLPEGHRGIIVSKKAARILCKNKFTNMGIKNLTEVDFNEIVLFHAKQIRLLEEMGKISLA